MEGKKRQLLWHGIALFLLGLVTGLVEQKFTNVRMGLAAHLEGVMNGTFLLALGAVWQEVNLTPRIKAAAYWAVLAGTYGNWMVTTLAAILGTAALSPISAAGHSAPAWQEAIVATGFVAIGSAIIAASVLVLWGLRSSAGAKPLSRYSGL
ncbi:hydrogenase [Bradyrhizobium sp. ISRA443]|uniref:hydrogenase n=1 Tax=unclassified Bradyrhizobium TaxID=2631580 RepID=UPI002479E9C8|nr:MULTISPECIES: hydrogenase [unclassified Bradyrhizobium]WGR96974.1 hydrogenase [Bradyrhizobium sp. ISRA436]WGS03861.1 hydrogenase [Bradyrhizobium sp. ISRA437]WGS10745.1 hydrogenase [Bradyrhizobium sp. ISRA443]